MDSLKYLPAKYRIKTNRDLDKLLNYLEKNKEMNDRFIYFVRSSNGLIKIGSTKHPKKRLEMLKRGSPLPISLIKIIEGSFAKELFLHKFFNNFRSHGEWFKENDILTKLLWFL